jgi:hypothetical protein
MSTRDQILANIKPDEYISPNALAKRIGGGMKATNLSYHLRAMLKDKTLTAIGATTGRQYAIADGAPPQQRKAKKPTKKTRPAKTTRKPTKPRKPAAPPPAAPVDAPEAFPPALTVDKRLVLVGMNAPAQIFTPEQTLAIADLVLDQFEPA